MIIKLKYLDTPVGSEGVFSDVNGATLKTDAELDLTNWTPDNADWETHDEATFTYQKNKADVTGDEAINRLILQDVINRHHTAPASTGGGGGSSASSKGGFNIIIGSLKTAADLGPLYVVNGDLPKSSFKDDVDVKKFYGNGIVGSTGVECFRGCIRLEEVNFPSLTGDIAYGSFFGCKALTSASFPSMTGSVVADAFNGCANLKDLKMNVAMKSKYSSTWQLPAGCVITWLNDDGTVDSTQTV